MDSHISSDTDGPSFVILDPGSIAPTDVEGTEFDSHVSFNIQTRLDQLITENRELREALTQNNLAMKSQFETLASWQSEVFKTHQSHKDKFAETRALVLKLREENTLLKNQVDVLTKSTESGASKESFTSLVDSLKTQLSAESYRLKQAESEKFVLIKERDAFREECTRLNLKITHLESQVVQKTEELSSLKHQVASQSPAVVSERRNVPEPESLKSWMYLNQMSLEPATIVETKSMAAEYTAEVKKNEEIEKSFKELEQKYEILTKEHVELAVTWKRCQSQNESLQDDLRDKDKLLNESIEELRAEREKVKSLATRCEELEVLNAQADCFKADFEEERKQRIKAISEKEDLAQEIRMLRVQIEELSRTSSGGQAAENTNTSRIPLATSSEVDPAAAAQFEVVHNIEAIPVPPPNIPQFTCPICSFRFQDEEGCIRHFDSCYEINQHTV